MPHKRGKSSSKPKPPPNHPIYSYKTQIVNKIRTNSVVIITGATGCGKSTQVPKYILENIALNENKHQVIACLHPRCVAAKSLAERVSLELGDLVGGLVGYHIRFERCYDETRTRIVFMTTGLMLMRMKGENCLDRFSVIIIDEAHERSIQTDVVLGHMSRYLSNNDRARLVIMSATLDVSLIRKYFPETAVINIKTGSDKISVIYRPLSSNENYILKIKTIVEEILKSSKKGHILIFLQSEEKVLKCRKSLSNLNRTKTIAFFANMDQEEKEKVFWDYGNRRKIIVATNVAETSLTIPGVDFVIDSGFVKRVEYDYECGVEKWMTKNVSIAEANQRKGRTGRTGRGTCYRLYDERCIIGETLEKKENSKVNDVPLSDTNEKTQLISEASEIKASPLIVKSTLEQLQDIDLDVVMTFCSPLFELPFFKLPKPPIEIKVEKFSDFPTPEILTANLGWMVLTLKSMGVDKIMDFPFIVFPEEKFVEKSIKELIDLSLLNATNEQLTNIGKQASTLPLEPRLAKVAVIASQLPCRNYVNKIIAMLGVRNVLKSPTLSRDIHKQYADEHGDLFHLLHIYNEAEFNWFSRQWCVDNSIDYSCMRYASRVFYQLESLLNFFKQDQWTSPPYNDNMVIKVFLSGFFDSISRRAENGKFLNVDNTELSLHKMSTVSSSEELVMYQIIQKPSETSNLVMKNCTALNRQMLKDLKPQKYKIKSNLWKVMLEKQLES